jgi:hypothetical protein
MCCISTGMMMMMLWNGSEEDGNVKKSECEEDEGTE